MPTLHRRVTPLLVLIFLALIAGSPLLAYPVSITINVTFVDIAGDSDPLGLGATGSTTGIISTTLDSATASGTSATYPATVVVTIPSLNDTLNETGTITISTSGQISASFASGENSFTATVVIPGLTLPTPSPSAFGTRSFSSPASIVNYNLLGAAGTVGVNGTITAVGLTATPASISVTASANGTAPAAQQISVGSNNPATPAIAYTATVSPSTATWLTLTGGTGTTPAAVTANFSTALSPGTYTASVLVNDSGDTAGPITIPVTYTVTTAGGGSSSLQVSPGSVTFNFFLPNSASGSQTIAVTSTAAAAGFSASVSGASFITVSPESGTTPGSITISGNGTGLSNGTYQADVNLTSSVGSATIPVTIIVTGGTGGGGGSVSPIGLEPPSLTFNVVPGQAAPPAQTVQLLSATPVSFSVANVALYLPITPTSGTTPATLTVPLDTTGLTAGTHIDYVEIKSGNTSAQLTVTVNVGSVTLSSTTTSLVYAYPATSASPLAQTVTVAQTGGGTGALTVTPSVPWLTATSSGQTVTITANPTGLSLGTVTGNVVITTPAGANSLTIPVTFAINSAPPGMISVTPASLAFVYRINGVIPPTQTITVSATSSATGITFSAFGASWLSVTSAPASTTAVGTLSINPQGLAPGVYTGSVLVSGANFANAPYFVPVTLTVSSSSTFGVSPASLTFSYQPNGAAPAAQTIALSSSVSNSITASANVPWISISPASASVTTTTPATFTITAAPGTLANGSYPGLISFIGGGASTLTAQLPVTLNIAAVVPPVLDAITSAMSYLTSPGSPGGFIALWGVGLGPAPPVPLQLANATTVATSAGGTQVMANGIPCPILFTSNEQVNAILPFSLAGQTSATITVLYQGVTSNAIVVPIAAASPGLFSLDASGSGGGAILNSDLSVNSSTNPAAVGSVIVLYGGGVGQTNPPGSDGLIVPVVAPFPAPVLPVTTTVAGQAAQILYAGDAPDLVSGILQVNAVIPPGTPSGAQPVVITVGTVSSQPNLLVYVQ